MFTGDGSPNQDRESEECLLVSLCHMGLSQETHDNEEDDCGREIRADWLTTIEVVDSPGNVGVGIRHVNGLLVEEMSSDDTNQSSFIADLSSVDSTARQGDDQSCEDHSIARHDRLTLCLYHGCACHP